jgi:hypothetical protein
VGRRGLACFVGGGGGPPPPARPTDNPAYTWEGEIFHSSWSLVISFFSRFLFLLNLEYNWTFISNVEIFVS